MVRIGLVLLVVLLVVGTGLATLVIGSVRQSFPQTSGDLRIEGLTSPVTVLRDEHGIPHIYADNAADLFRAQGFVTAQDRFFQMDVRRHIASGRLAEMLGEEGLASDKVVRTLGWRRVAAAELPILDSTTRQNLQAYADGVNAYIAAEGIPNRMGIEYALLSRKVPEYRVEQWTPVDSLAWLKAVAWDLRGSDDELVRARLAATISPAQVAQLYPAYPSTTHRSVLADSDWAPFTAGAGAGMPALLQSQPVTASVTAASAALAAVPAVLSAGEGTDANAWVVAGSHTTTGRPLLANDPHMALDIPGVWTQIGLHCRAVTKECPYDVAGVTFAGLPGVVIGHNARIAWGFTNLAPDVTDYYLEDIVDGAYLFDGVRKPLDVRTETIKVAGAPDVELSVRSTGHGPLLSDVADPVALAGQRVPIGGSPQTRSYAVSLAWAGLTPGRTADALFGFNTAANWEDFRSAATNFATPAQNLVYADVDGHIGYQTPGLIPIRASATPGAPPGYWPAPGWLSAYDWKGFVPFAQLPWVKDPAEGYIVSANQQVTPNGGPFITADWDYGYRAQRIRRLIQAKGKLSVDDMIGIQSDTLNGFAPELTKALLAVDVDDFTTQAQALLKDWGYTQPNDKSRAASAASYYNAVWANVLANTFGDELPRSLAPNGNSRWMAVMSDLLKDPRNAWWDDRRTPGVIEGRDEILRKSMVDAHMDLVRHLGKDPATWQWGRLHGLTLRNRAIMTMGLPSIVEDAFSVGPLGAPGGNGVVNSFAWNAAQATVTTGTSASSSRLDVASGPTARMVMDVGGWDASTWIISTGISGHAFHANYKDQVDAWMANEPLAWAFGQKAVAAAATSELHLAPAAAS